MKTCNKCHESKSLDQFPKNRHSPDGINSICKLCKRATDKVYQDRMKKQDPEVWNRRRLAAHYKYYYGIILAEYEQLYERQGGVCAICHKPETTIRKGGQSLSVDHDHDTKKVHGLLCQRYNAMLGMSEDSPDRLRAAAQYLEKK